MDSGKGGYSYVYRYVDAKQKHPGYKTVSFWSHSYIAMYFTVLTVLLIDLAIFIHQGCFCLAYHYCTFCEHKQMLLLTYFRCTCIVKRTSNMRMLLELKFGPISYITKEYGTKPFYMYIVMVYISYCMYGYYVRIYVCTGDCSCFMLVQ